QSGAHRIVRRRCLRCTPRSPPWTWSSRKAPATLARAPGSMDHVAAVAEEEVATVRNLIEGIGLHKRLPDRRLAETFEIEVSGLRYTATIGRFPDGRIGEVFLQNHKPGSQSDANARDAAVAASLAIQYGCPLHVLQRALLRDARGNP